MATIAWGLRKCSRAIELVLIFLIAMKPGFIHAVYSMLLAKVSFAYLFIHLLILYKVRIRALSTNDRI